MEELPDDNEQSFPPGDSSTSGASGRRWTCEACGCNTNSFENDRRCTICGTSQNNGEF